MDTRFATKELCVPPDASVMMQRTGEQHSFRCKTRLLTSIDINNNHVSVGIGLIEVKVNTKLELPRTINVRSSQRVTCSFWDIGSS